MLYADVPGIKCANEKKEKKLFRAITAVRLSKATNVKNKEIMRKSVTNPTEIDPVSPSLFLPPHHSLSLSLPISLSRSLSLPLAFLRLLSNRTAEERIIEILGESQTAE